MKFKEYLFLFLVLTICLNANAKAGTESGGGGDPDAVDFLMKAKAIGEWVKTGDTSFSFGEAQRVYATVQKLSLKMDDGSHTPIVMADKNLFDQSGANKIALFHKDAFKIEVTRQKWNQLNEEKKYITAALEILGLAGIPNRYDFAAQVKNDIQSIIQTSQIVGPSKPLSGAQFIYVALATTFPEFNEHTGGFSYAIFLDRLDCHSTNTVKEHGLVVVTECTATDYRGKSITREASNLFLVLLNQRVILDRQSEGGTTYINLEGLDCEVIDPKPSSPDDAHKPEYYCSMNNMR